MARAKLTWGYDNSGLPAPEEVEVYRDGVLIDTIPPSPSEYIDNLPSGTVFANYYLIGRTGGESVQSPVVSIEFDPAPQEDWTANFIMTSDNVRDFDLTTAELKEQISGAWCKFRKPTLGTYFDSNGLTVNDGYGQLNPGTEVVGVELLGYTPVSVLDCFDFSDRQTTYDNFSGYIEIEFSLSDTQPYSWLTIFETRQWGLELQNGIMQFYYSDEFQSRDTKPFSEKIPGFMVVRVEFHPVAGDPTRREIRIYLNGDLAETGLISGYDNSFVVTGLSFFTESNQRGYNAFGTIKRLSVKRNNVV